MMKNDEVHNPWDAACSFTLSHHLPESGGELGRSLVYTKAWETLKAWDTQKPKSAEPGILESLEYTKASEIQKPGRHKSLGYSKAWDTQSPGKYRNGDF